VNVDTGQFKAITGQVAELAGRVEELVGELDATRRVAGIFYDAGRADEAATREPWRPRRHARGDHLKVIR
jgi:hypothetical protein